MVEARGGRSVLLADVGSGRLRAHVLNVFETSSCWPFVPIGYLGLWVFNITAVTLTILTVY